MIKKKQKRVRLLIEMTRFPEKKKRGIKKTIIRDLDYNRTGKIRSLSLLFFYDDIPEKKGIHDLIPVKRVPRNENKV